MPRPAPSRPKPSRAGGPRLRSSVFRSGNSQAVRIPVALRLDCTQVTIRRGGAALVIGPVNADGWPVGHFAAFESGSTLARPPQPRMPALRRSDASR